MKPFRKRVSVVVLHEGKVLGFYAEDPINKKRYFFLPGGLIEPGETAFEAARRETREETGYTIEIMAGPSITRRYDFEWNGVVHDCETVFFEGVLSDVKPVTVSDAPYHLGVGWVPAENIETVFAYHPDILEPVVSIVEGQKNY